MQSFAPWRSNETSPDGRVSLSPSRRHKQHRRPSDTAAFSRLPTEDSVASHVLTRPPTRSPLLQEAAASAAAAAGAATTAAAGLAMQWRKHWLVAVLLVGLPLTIVLLLWHFSGSTQQQKQQKQFQQQLATHPRGTFTSPWQRDTEDGAPATPDRSVAPATATGWSVAAALGKKRPKEQSGTFFVQHLPGYTAAAAMPSADAAAATAAAEAAAAHGGSYEYLLSTPLSASSAALAGGSAAAAAAQPQQQSLKDVALPVPFSAPPQQEERQQSMLMSLGSRSARFPTFTAVPGSSFVHTEPQLQQKQQQQQLLLKQLEAEGWRGELGALADYNNDMHVDLIFLGSSAHFPACRGSTTTSTPAPTRAAAAADELTVTSTTTVNPQNTGITSNKGSSSTASSNSTNSICGSTISVYTWSVEGTTFTHQLSVHLKETVDSIVAVDWTHDGRVDIIAITLPPAAAVAAGAAAGRGIAAAAAAAYGLVAFVQRPSGALDRVWDSQQLVAQLLQHRNASRQQHKQTDTGEAADGDTGQHSPAAATISADASRATAAVDAFDEAAAQDLSTPVEDPAADAVGFAAFGFGAGRLHARADAAATARDAPGGPPAPMAPPADREAAALGNDALGTGALAPLSPIVVAAAEDIAADMTDDDLVACALSGIHPLVADLTFDHYPDMLAQTPATSQSSSSKRQGGEEEKVFRFIWVNMASQGKEGFAPRKWSAASDLFEVANSTDTSESRQQQQVQHQEAHITNPHSSAIADIDGDCRADLLLMVRLPGSSSLSVEIWLSRFDGTSAKWKKHPETIALPQGSGQFVLADFDADGTLDLLVPTCERNEEGVCIRDDSLILLPNAQPPLCGSFWWTSRTVEKCRRPFELCDPNDSFSIAHYGSKEATASVLDPDSTIHFFGDSAKPPTLAVGDVDGDGFPDIALVAVKEGGVRAARIYRNVPTELKNAPTRRRFQLVSEFVATAEGETLLCNRVAFFDFREKGALDLVCQGQPKSPSSSSNPFATLRAYMRPMEAAGDSRFFKATSLNGACPYSFCTRRTLLPSPHEQQRPTLSHNALDDKEEGQERTHQQKPNSFSLQMMPDLPPPYGAAAVGANFKLTVTDLNGTKTPRTGAQMAQSAHAPLALPFELFGLGQTNNYVEEFFVGLPLSQLAAYSMWVSLIPNSQVVVMPYPLERPKSWQLELSVHPSRSFASILISFSDLMEDINIYD